ncbi:hypothetical protein C7H84_18995 [Burkholderia sp. Nafp2/4-1b]|uniref:hypothetical protein n=1 Tax=Burkholderia sp. Nafp2/4-1b TaxID=2116686 RepID=UPI000EF91A0E|nr:hypothetical protein [Burkholderia sp. Nafp2/4-1b]RKU01805.1 hypothetical protein C7H84_18995 [Burkholderia sp. Nafp2/4-1b]
MARSAADPVTLAFDLDTLSLDQRHDYLCTLWRANVDPFVFVDIARRLGDALECRWDFDAGMPVLTSILLH